jgi:hypothetical protein
MSTSLSVELTPSHCGARARCLASSWSEKAELLRVIDEHALELRDLCTCAVSGTTSRVLLTSWPARRLGKRRQAKKLY